MPPDESALHPEILITEPRTVPWRELLGIALVLLSTAGIGIVPTFARLAYDGGSDALTVITARGIVTAVICWLVTLGLRRPVRMGRNPTIGSLGLGVLYAAHAYCLLGAIDTLPVNIVVLLFYLHPLMIAVGAIALGRAAITVAKLVAMVAALGGLTLAVGLASGPLDPRGIVFSLAAAVLAAAVIVGSAKAMKNADGLAVTSWMVLSAAVTLVVCSALAVHVQLPVTSTGWFGFGGVAISYTIGTVTFFAAVPLLGALRAAMISNLEPVLGILFALAILGEQVSPVQGLGIVIVIGAILAMELTWKRQSPPRGL